MTKHQDEFGVFIRLFRVSVVLVYPFISSIRCTRLSVYFKYPLYSFIRLFRVSVVLVYPFISSIRCTKLLIVPKLSDTCV